MHAYPDDLHTYPIPQSLAAYLQHVDAVAQRTARAGFPVPPAITLEDGDYAVVDRIVRHASGGCHTAATVSWNGRRLARRVVAVAA